MEDKTIFMTDALLKKRLIIEQKKALIEIWEILSHASIEAMSGPTKCDYEGLMAAITLIGLKLKDLDKELDNGN